MRQTFSKHERLCRKILIAELFNQGTSFTVFPFRVTWNITVLPTQTPVQLLISVPKSMLRKAHDRNLVRRRIREAYRRNKTILYGALEGKPMQMALALTYVSKEIISYDQLQDKIIVLLYRLTQDHANLAG